MLHCPVSELQPFAVCGINGTVVTPLVHAVLLFVCPSWAKQICVCISASVGVLLWLRVRSLHVLISISRVGEINWDDLSSERVLDGHSLEN